MGCTDQVLVILLVWRFPVAWLHIAICEAKARKVLVRKVRKKAVRVELWLKQQNKPVKALRKLLR
jgi:hypothetical protein